MGEVSVADTAFSIAQIREEEQALPPAQRLFEDPYAHLFRAAGAHAAEATARFLALPFFRDGIRLRTRFIDDAVRDGLAAGLDQVVILGVGFDSRALRMNEIEARGARVYEVDSPSQIARKIGVLATAGITLPSRVAFIGFDFERADFEDALTADLCAKGFRQGEGAVFVWEGVIGYIDDAAIDRSLRFMARAGGPSTRLVFTHHDGAFGKESARERTGRMGFKSCTDTTLDDVWRLHFNGEPHPAAILTRVGIAQV